jgi:hypothetical protein
MSQSYITEWATNVTIHNTFVAHSVICYCDICCTLSYMSWWHLLLIQLYVMVTIVAHSVICHGDICCSLSYMWLWHLLLTQLYVKVAPVAHSVICHGDICCSFSYMWWWYLLLTQLYVMVQMSPWHITEWTKNVTMTYNWVRNKCHHHI